MTSRHERETSPEPGPLELSNDGQRLLLGKKCMCLSWKMHDLIPKAD